LREVDLASESLVARHKGVAEGVHNRSKQAQGVEQLGGKVGVDGVVQEAAQSLGVVGKINGTKDPVLVSTSAANGWLGVEVDVEDTSNGFGDGCKVC
jgi:hypothetical protein